MDSRRLGVTVLLAMLSTPLVAYVGVSLIPGSAGYVVASSSMEPTFGPGALIYVQGTNDYQEGDVVTFVEENRTVTHRIVETTPNGFQTKGDANDAVDEWRVTEREIVGEVVLAVPWYGHLLRIARTPIGYVGLVFLPVSLLIGLELRDLWRET